MKIKVDDIKCSINYSEEEFYLAVKNALAKTTENQKYLDGPLSDINKNNVRILKQSIDARKKPALLYIFSVEVFWDESLDKDLPNSLLCVQNEKKPPYDLIQFKSQEQAEEQTKKPTLEKRPVIVGSGPAGLFAALVLAAGGHKPILIERGKTVDARVKDILDFWEKADLSPESNVQFGEGGAGTFSDGKLTTGIKDPACRAVLETFVAAGAPLEILTDAKPHIGSDLLRDIVKRIRKEIESLGGTVLFETKLTEIHVENNKIHGIEVIDGDNRINDIETDSVILAIGHSARDTIRMLSKNGVEMQAKPFSMGVRIEHLQKDINASQYGKQPLEIEKNLPAAEYKLSCHLPNGRDVYTFCMCPGGQVIASTSGEQQVVTNGMSLYSRAQKNSNSAILVNVTPFDFEGDSPLAGMDFQEKWERRAFLAGGSSYNAPAQYVGDFLKNTKEKIKNPINDKSRNSLIESVIPTYKPGVKWTKIDTCLPSFIIESIRLALPVFDRKLKGFANPGAVMTGIESRSSSPVRILRNNQKMANIYGIYPCGEGAGYAGGIMSAAVDGIACANSYISEKNNSGMVNIDNNKVIN